jgi:hypothetical protein
MRISTVCSLGVILLVGCYGQKSSSPLAKTTARGPKPATEPTEAGKAFRLAQEPADAKPVLEARKDLKDGDEVVVVGRIGGSVKPFTGRAAFTIVDASIKPCSENGDDACPTPWDYCCGVGKEELAKATALVKLVGDDGQTRADDARTLLGLTELQTVVVKGKAKRDEAGNFTVLMNGIFVRPGKGSS